MGNSLHNLDSFMPCPGEPAVPYQQWKTIALAFIKRKEFQLMRQQPRGTNGDGEDQQSAPAYSDEEKNLDLFLALGSEGQRQYQGSPNAQVFDLSHNDFLKMTTQIHAVPKLTKEESFSDDEVEELCEPKFKYKRILNDVSKIFNQDAASCFAIHDKFLALGTQWGRIYIMDHLGNMLPNKVVVAHTVAVNQISIDKSGDYLASCSNDGKVFIYGLASTEFNQTVSMDRPIRSVAIDPNFSRSNSGQHFVTGDRVLTLHQRGFFSKDKQQVVFAGKERDGFIHNISWRGPYLAFANDTGVRVYDYSLKALITHVVRRHELSLRSDIYPATICWLDEDMFCIGWATTVTICGIRENPTHMISTDLPGKLVEIRYMWDLPRHYIAGVSYTSGLADPVTGIKRIDWKKTVWKDLVFLCLCKRDETEDTASIKSNASRQATQDSDAASAQAADGDRISHSSSFDADSESDPEKQKYPRVWLVEPMSFHDFEVITEDIIEMRDVDKLMCHNYHMEGVGEDNIYLLLSNRDMIEVRPCSSDDHVSWLLENNLYKKALEFTKQNAHSLEKFNAVAVGKEYLEHLMEDEQYGEAAEMLSKVCGKKKDLWEEYVTKFEQVHQLKEVAPFMPTRDPQLEPECYEMVLLAFLKDDVHGFRKLIKEWSSDLYRVGALITQTLEKLYRKNLDRDTHSALLCTLGQLYTYERKYDRALSIYMNLGDRSVFQLIDRFRLFPLVKDRIRELMDIDTDLSVRLLLENEDSLPAATVMKQLTKQPKLQLAYLDRLFSRNEGAEFADLAISLYADHDPKRLLPFLRSSEHYKLDKALEICKQRKMMKEVVFLLGRGGNRREALKVIINEQRDIFQAIDFCKEHDDADLWVDLINFGVQRPEFITILMRNIGTYVDPTLLIRKIPSRMQIPGLPDSLVKILHDYSLQISLQEGCRRVTLTDCHDLVRLLMRMQKSGVLIGEKESCAICHKRLMRPDPRYAIDIGYYFCKHAYHQKCLVGDNWTRCPVCTSTTNRHSLRKE